MENKNYEKLFEAILEKDEKLIKVMKPNKARVFWGVVIGLFFTLFWLPIFAISALWETQGNQQFYVGVTTHFWTVLGIILGVMVFIISLSVLFQSLWYKKRFDAYTTKRILIRTGVIGVDFKSLEYKSLNASTVKVGLIDKMIRKNTGTIMFGSPSSPLAAFGRANMSGFSFIFIQNPYEVLKEVKEYMELKKAEIVPVQGAVQVNAQTTTKASTTDMAAELTKIEELKKSGVITDKEYEAMRKKTLGL